MGKSSPSKPKKPQPTAEEWELARQGSEKYNRYISRYAPLEDDAIAASDRPTMNLRAGRANADVMQQVSDDAMSAMASAPIGQGVNTLNKVTGALASAGAAGATDAVLGDRTYRDKQSLNMINTGLGQAGSSQSSLTQLGQQTTALAVNRYAAETSARLKDSVDNTQALNQLATTAGGMYMGYKQNKDLSDKLGRTLHQSRTAGRNDFYGRTDGIARLY